ncbi:hypothetical protein KSU19_14910 [Enterobacter quasiroggenkampii]|nr:hypothetical protein [Enterobacter quasiroggenkampii]
MTREPRQPDSNLIYKLTDWQGIVLQHYYPTGLFGSPLQRAVMIPVSPVIPFIDNQVCTKFTSQQYC